MQLYVLRAGQQTGPHPPEQIRHELATGSLRTSDLAWYEGAPNWLPLFTVLGLSAPPVPAAFHPPSAPQTSGPAVASMLLGLLGPFLGGLPSLPAVICGHASLSQIKRSGGRLRGRGMAIAGLITGYLSLVFYGVVILWLIFGLALPFFHWVDTEGRPRDTIVEAKQIGLACKMYAEDNDGNFPKTLDQLVPAYLHDKRLFVCPLDSTGAPMGYEYFGGTENDDPNKILLQSKATTSDGRRMVVYVDNRWQWVGK